MWWILKYEHIFKYTCHSKKIIFQWLRNKWNDNHWFTFNICVRINLREVIWIRRYLHNENQNDIISQININKKKIEWQILIRRNDSTGNFLLCGELFEEPPETLCFEIVFCLENEKAPSIAINSNKGRRQ